MLTSPRPRYDGKEIKIYINSQLRETASGGSGSAGGLPTLPSQAVTLNPREWVMSEEEGEAIHTKGDLMIGGFPGKYAFDGFIDEVRLWDEARTEEQLKENLNKPFTEPITPGLLGQWTFNEGAGEMVIDAPSPSPRPRPRPRQRPRLRPRPKPNHDHRASLR